MAPYGETAARCRISSLPMAKPRRTVRAYDGERGDPTPAPHRAGWSAGPRSRLHVTRFGRRADDRGVEVPRHSPEDRANALPRRPFAGDAPALTCIAGGPATGRAGAAAGSPDRSPPGRTVTGITKPRRSADSVAGCGLKCRLPLRAKRARARNRTGGKAMECPIFAASQGLAGDDSAHCQHPERCTVAAWLACASRTPARARSAVDALARIVVCARALVEQGSAIREEVLATAIHAAVAAERPSIQRGALLSSWVEQIVDRVVRRERRQHAVDGSAWEDLAVVAVDTARALRGGGPERANFFQEGVDLRPARGRRRGLPGLVLAHGSEFTPIQMASRGRAKMRFRWRRVGLNASNIVMAGLSRTSTSFCGPKDMDARLKSPCASRRSRTRVPGMTPNYGFNFCGSPVRPACRGPAAAGP